MARPDESPEELFDAATVAAMWKCACPRRPISPEQLLRLCEGLINATHAAYRADERRPNVVRREIEQLHAAAVTPDYLELAHRLNGLSPTARALLWQRAMHWKSRLERQIEWGSAPTLTQQHTVLDKFRHLCRTPESADEGAAAGAEEHAGQLRVNRTPMDELMSEEASRDVACEVVVHLSQRGTEFPGHRAPRRRPRIAGPAMQKQPNRKIAGKVFIARLEYAWWDATGEMPPLTASATRPGPFVRFAKLALESAGMKHFNVVKLISDLHRARLDDAKHPAPPDDEPDLNVSATGANPRGTRNG